MPRLEKQTEKGDHWRLFVRLHGTGHIGEAVERRPVESFESCMAEIVLKLEAFIAVGDAVTEVQWPLWGSTLTILIWGRQLNPHAKIAWKIVSGFYTVRSCDPVFYILSDLPLRSLKVRWIDTRG